MRAHLESILRTIVSRKTCSLIKDYVAYLRGKGIDTEYWRQAVELHEIYVTWSFKAYIKGFVAPCVSALEPAVSSQGSWCTFMPPCT